MLLVLFATVALAAPAAASAAGSISGTVTDASGNLPIAGVRVCAFGEDAFESVEEFCVHSGADGAYSIPSLPAAEYTVEFLSGVEGLNYVYQAWEGKPVGYLADLVEVGDEEVSGIDAELTEGGRLGGRVVSAATGLPLANVEVCAEPGGLYNEEGCAVTDGAGEYMIVGLSAETYWVEFFPPEDAEFLPQYYDDEPGILYADDVEVSIGNLTAGIDAALQEAGQIAGTVTDAAGHYLVRRVPAGVYNVSFNQFSRLGDYAIQWYRCLNGPPATPVAVASGRATTSIDAGLVRQWATPCPQAAVPPAATPPPPGRHKVKKHCRKGLKRKWVKGKRRCVRVKRKAKDERGSR